MGSSKGGMFERDISRYLSKWAGAPEKELFFWRSGGSGSVSTISKCNAELSNDIVAIKTEGKFLTNIFSIELKKGYPDSSLDKHLKKNKNNSIRDFWVQANQGANKNNREAMLIYGKKGLNPWCGISLHMFEILKFEQYGLPYMIMSFGKEFNLPVLVFIDIDDFFTLITPDQIKALISNQIG